MGRVAELGSLGRFTTRTHMPQLKWDETEFIECLEVVPEVAEHQTQHIFTVSRHGLTLTITIWQLESMVTLALRRDGQTLLLTQFTLAIRGDVSLQRHKSGDYLEFCDCVVCPGRFSYIHGPGDPSDTARFGHSLVVQVAVAPEIQIHFSEVQR